MSPLRPTRFGSGATTRGQSSRRSVPAPSDGDSSPSLTSRRWGTYCTVISVSLAIFVSLMSDTVGTSVIDGQIYGDNQCGKKVKILQSGSEGIFFSKDRRAVRFFKLYDARLKARLAFTSLNRTSRQRCALRIILLFNFAIFASWSCKVGMSCKLPPRPSWPWTRSMQLRTLHEKGEWSADSSFRYRMHLPRNVSGSWILVLVDVDRDFALVKLQTLIMEVRMNVSSLTAVFLPTVLCVLCA